MKGFHLLSLTVALAILLLPAQAFAGPKCDAQGGVCRPACPGDSIGQLDCPSGSGPFGNYDCCVSTPVGGGAPGGSFIPPTCGFCPPGDEAFCAKYPGIQTALGCIPTHPVAFVSVFMNILLFMGGGIAFLLMIVGAGFILTSRGQPEQIQRGKQVFVGALVGLLMIIFSTFLLELIGVDILGFF